MKKHPAFLTAILMVLSPLVGGGELQAQASGAELWGRTCTRCHNGRAINERTDREWTTIVNHMRARANLTRSDARTILEFLQATNAPNAGAVSRAPHDPSFPTGEVAVVKSESDAVQVSAGSDAARLEALGEYLERLARDDASLP